MTVAVTYKHPAANSDHVGLILDFLDERDPRSAREQLHANYAHGGGWNDFQGFVRSESGLKYPGDPPMRLLAEMRLREELIQVFEAAWVTIVQPDGSYSVSRMD